jgi:hypothetical protein|tara:strand:- start:7636 stop:7791 length:156 start_codon:yes stop_codon:yes gene_type:complete
MSPLLKAVIKKEKKDNPFMIFLFTFAMAVLTEVLFYIVNQKSLIVYIMERL